MLIIHQFPSMCMMIWTKSILAVPLTTILSPRGIFDSFPPLITEDNSGSSDLVYSSSMQDACLSSQTELYISSTELGLCPGGGTTLPDKATPLPPANLELTDLLDVFGIGSEDEQSPDAVNQGSWDGEDLNPCRERNPYHLHFCCEGELRIFDGAQLYSIEDCVIRMYCMMTFFARFRRASLLWEYLLMRFWFWFLLRTYVS